MLSQTNGKLVVSAGDSCTAPVDTGSGASSLTTAAAMGVPLLFGGAARMPAVTMVAAAATGLLSTLPQANAQTVSECETATIEVEIYLDTTADEIVMREAQSGDFEVCPPESK